MNGTELMYHPDPEINAAMATEVRDAERYDLAIGYPPRIWRCPGCRHEHRRGHFHSVGTHRCLACGYVGTGGIMRGTSPGDQPGDES